MAKLEIDNEKEFVPFSIHIKTKEEMNFLYGLFNTCCSVKKVNAEHYKDELNRAFYKLLETAVIRNT